jgi:hypothetical protein
MSERIALRAVFGQDEANHGMTRYRVDSEGLVHVAPEAVAFLISKGGFALPRTSVAASPARSTSANADELVRMHHHEAAGCSYAGRGYSSDENGDVLVPAKAAAELFAHGFVPVPEDVSSRHAGPVGKARGGGPTRSCSAVRAAHGAEVNSVL